MNDSAEAETAITQNLLDNVVRHIVDVIQPLRVGLVESAAQGARRPCNDQDILMVMPYGAHRRRTAQRLWRSLFRLGMPQDIIVVTESDVKNCGANASLVIDLAPEEGRDLYQA